MRFPNKVSILPLTIRVGQYQGKADDPAKFISEFLRKENYLNNSIKYK